LDTVEFPTIVILFPTIVILFPTIVILGLDPRTSRGAARGSN
jgi:hypothetical protein